MELERAQRLVHQQAISITDLKKQAESLERVRVEAEALRGGLSAAKTEGVLREQAVASELAGLRQAKSLLTHEVESLKTALDTQRRGMDLALAEGDRLRRELVDLKDDNERVKQDVHLLENGRAEVQLQSLRRDLEDTVLQIKQSEEEKQEKDNMIKRLQNDVSKEKEKTSLLRTQIALLDERLKVNKMLTSYHLSPSLFLSL